MSYSDTCKWQIMDTSHKNLFVLQITIIQYISNETYRIERNLFAKFHTNLFNKSQKIILRNQKFF